MDPLSMRKNEYFHRAFNRLIVVLLTMLMLSCVLIGLLFSSFIHRKTPAYYASTITGRQVEITAMSSPTLSDSFISNWAEEVVQDSLNLSFLKYTKQLDRASHYFTPGAWQTFMSVIEDQGLLSSIKQQKLIVTAIVKSRPFIVSRGSLMGRYYWLVKVPVLMQFDAGGQRSFRTWRVLLRVVRIPVLDNKEGISVEQFNVG